MTVQRFATEEAWIQAAKEAFSAALDLASKEGRAVHIALSGGSTPEVVYKNLAAMPLRGQRICLWLVDERQVPFSSPDRNGSMIQRAFADHHWNPAPEIRQWPFDPDKAEASDALKAAKEYSESIESALGSSPAFDLTFLGIGDDAHTASLFPGSPLLADDGGRLAAPAIAQVQPLHRLTLTLSALKNSRDVIILTKGKSKAMAVARAVSGDPTAPVSRMDGPGHRILYLD